MRKQVLVLIANVEYPSKGSFFLAANSYVIDSIEGLDVSVKNFREDVEKDGCRIINFLAHIVPEWMYQ